MNTEVTNKWKMDEQGNNIKLLNIQKDICLNFLINFI